MSNLSNKQLLDKEGVSTLIELIKRKTDNVATVAITGDYNDLENKPVIPTVPTRVSAFVNDIGYLNSESDPTFRSHVAYNIQQDDIDNWNNKQDILESGTNIKTINNLPILGEGNINISSAGELNTNNSDSLNVPTETESFAGTINLHKVSKTGSYEDLNNKPTIPTNVSSLNNDADYLQSETDPTVPNWAKASSKPSYSYNEIEDTPNLATVATSGSYNDLSNKPTIPAAQIQSDWEQSDNTSVDFIKNKPTIPVLPSKAETADNVSGCAIIPIVNLSAKPRPDTYGGSGTNISLTEGQLCIFRFNYGASLAGQKINLSATGYPQTADKTFLVNSRKSPEEGIIDQYTNVLCRYDNGSWVMLACGAFMPNVMSDSDISTGTSTTEKAVTPKLLRDNFYTESEINTKLGDKQDALTAEDGIAIDSNNNIRTTGIPYGECDSTSTATAFTVTVPGIYKLEDGVCCMVKNGVITSASGFTLNVNGLGAKPSYNNMTTGNDITPTAPTRDTTIFNINYTMLFVYSETLVTGGAWICYRGYDANTNTIGYQLRTNSTVMTVTDTARYYKIYFTSADGTQWVPASANSTNDATTARTVNTRPINPFGRIVYTSASTKYSAGANLAATTIWDLYNLTLGYSFNRTGAELMLTEKEPVYIKCAPQADGSAIIDATTPYVQALPSTNDGKIYIFLGIATSATQIELFEQHPIYYYDGTGIRVWTGVDVTNKYDKTGGEISGNVLIDGDLDLKIEDPDYDSGITLEGSLNNNLGTILTLDGYVDNTHYKPILRNIGTPNSNYDAANKKYVDDHLLIPTYYLVELNPDGSVKNLTVTLNYNTIASNLTDNTKADYLDIIWESNQTPGEYTRFYAPCVGINEVNNGDLIFSTVIYHVNSLITCLFSLNNLNVLTTVGTIPTPEILINKAQSVVTNPNQDSYPSTLAVFNEFLRKPVVIWETSGTGLTALETDLSNNIAWQLTGLDMTPYKRIKVYSKAAQKTGTTASASTTAAMVLEISLDSRATGPYGGVYVGSVISQKPNDRNRFATLTCAISADKTSFAVMRMTNLYGTGATDNSDVGGYVFMIEGYYD